MIKKGVILILPPGKEHDDLGLFLDLREFGLEQGDRVCHRVLGQQNYSMDTESTNHHE